MDGDGNGNGRTDSDRQWKTIKVDGDNGRQWMAMDGNRMAMEELTAMTTDGDNNGW